MRKRLLCPTRGFRLYSPFDTNALFSVAFDLRRLLRVRKEALAVYGGHRQGFSTAPQGFLKNLVEIEMAVVGTTLRGCPLQDDFYQDRHGGLSLRDHHVADRKHSGLFQYPPQRGNESPLSPVGKIHRITKPGLFQQPQCGSDCPSIQTLLSQSRLTFGGYSG